MFRKIYCLNCTHKKNFLFPILRLLHQPRLYLTTKSIKQPSDIRFDDDEFSFPAMLGFPKSDANIRPFSMDLVEKEKEFCVHAGIIN
jgi:hypothetical protein